MDKNNIGPRKLSRGKSGLQGARAFLSRRYSVKRSETLDQHHPANNPFFNKHDNNPPKGKERERSSLDEYYPPPRPFFPMRSIIPDPLSELPTWYKTDEIVFSTAAQYRARYPMHNPVGPRRYRNHHLGPRSLEKRPPSVFSPSFPPMAATADRPQENKLPGPSRTPSGSPLPTPTSSQTRIHDVRGRTRKLSQTAHDGVDMLDVTDPWGTNWHHQSPYDVGHNHERVSPESSEPPTATTTLSRPRRMSMTTSGSRHKTVTPSPLSQSTSAIHLVVDPPPPQIPRRLSKNRKPFRGLFGGSFDAGHTHKPDVESLKRGLSLGATIPSSASSTTTDKKEKRASFMGRLVKRFSVMRKTDSSRASMTGSHDHSHHTVSTQPSVDLHASTTRNTPSPTKPDLRHVKSVDTARQVPPPQAQDEASQSATSGTAQNDGDSQSVSSIEANYSIGKLTIANPDDPSPTSTSPVNTPTPLRSVPERAIEVDTFRLRHERPQQILEVPMSSSPPPLDSPVDSSPFPIPSRLSTILSADHPESSIAPSPSSPLPDLPPVTPAVAPVPIKPESPLPPSPQPTRPPTPVEKTSTTYAPSPPTSPKTSPSMGTNGRDALSNGMLPSVSSSARLSLPSVPSMEDSPLSRASMIVNPPTPHPPAIVIPTPPVSTLPVPQIQPHHSQDSQRSQESTSKKNGSQRVKASSGSTKVRQTETFKLARSPSGNVHGVGQGFVAEGELWEVVETPTEERRSRREKSKSKDKEREKDKEQEKDKGKDREREKASGSGGATTSRRESKKHDRGNTEDDSEHQKGRHRRSVNDRHDNSSSSPTPPTRTPSSETPQRLSNPERRRSSTKDIRESRGDSVRSTQTPRSFVDKPQPAPPIIISSGSRREQRMSGSAPTRPSSEFQSAHDVNALKAKEAWDLERLWKGRSMVYGPDGAAFLSTRPTIGSDSRPSTIMSADIHRATSIPSVSDLHRASTMPVSHAPAHGSNHTYFVVQSTPPNMPNGQYPPIIYTPPQSPPDPSGQIPYSRREYPKTHRSFSEHIPFPSPDLSPPRRPLANPLPEPPRLSSYKPSPLPESLAGPAEGTSSPEYWTKYAGVTTTH